MAPRDAQPADSSSGDEIAKLLAVLIRLQLGSQTELIFELERVGLTATRIAELAGTTPATVRATIHQRRTRAGSGRNTTKKEPKP